MARTDSLSNYLTDVVQAVKNKKGDQASIKASELDTEITNLPTGGGENEYLDFSNRPQSRYTEDASSNIVSKWFLKKIPDLDLSDIIGTYRYMFQNLEVLEEIGKITPNPTVTSYMSMFEDAKNLVSIDLSGFKECRPTKVNQMFYNCTKLKDVDFTNIIFGTDTSASCSSMFRDCTSLEYVDFSQSQTENLTDCSTWFYGCTNLKTITRMNLSGAKNVASIVVNCTSLTDIGGFEELGKGYTQQTANYSNYTLALANCSDLTHESLMNVINGLYDLNLTYDVANGGTLYTQKLILGATNLAKLTEEEIAIATNKGWTVS